MKNNIEMAKEIIKSVFPEHCTYDDMRYARLHSTGEEFKKRYGVHIEAGCFRYTMIPQGCDFVIKFGKDKYGNRQCAREQAIYRKSVEADLSEYFAKLYGTFRYHNHIFYVFQKVDMSGVRGHFSTRNQALRDFISENDICDLHGENYGKINGRPVLCDYAGLTESEWQANCRW